MLILGLVFVRLLRWSICVGCLFLCCGCIVVLLYDCFRIPLIPALNGFFYPLGGVGADVWCSRLHVVIVLLRC